MGFFKYKLAMLVHMSSAFLVERTLLKMSLAVVISAVGAEITPRKLIIFPPTLSQVRRVSDFCGSISSTILS